MIFSKAKWDNGKEIGQYVPTSASLGYDKMSSSLQSAEDLFLVPLLGADMMQSIIDIYDTPPIERSVDDEQLLSIAQRAEANLAFWYNFDALQLRITDQGFQRQGSDDWQQAYKYQEDRLREGFKVKGFNAIDLLLDFLESNIDTYTAYSGSPAHITRSYSLVKTTEEVERWVFIGHSRLMFLRLSAEFPTVEEDILQAELGDELYEKLQRWLHLNGRLPEDFETFRQRCVRVVVTGAAIRVLQRTGNLTERGLYFSGISAENSENVTWKNASDGEIGSRLEGYQEDLRRGLAALRSYVIEHFDEGRKKGHVVRDNDGHAGFFAF